VAHTYTTIRIHVVFSTQGRRPLLLPEIQPRVWDYLGGIGNHHSIPINAVGGFENHAHILMSLPPTITLSKAVQTLKAFSSKWLNESGAMKNGRFAWQEGYSAFSVSQSNVDAVVDYIRAQPDHHRKHSFKDELRALLIKHEVQFEEEYVLG